MLQKSFAKTALKPLISLPVGTSLNLGKGGSIFLLFFPLLKLLEHIRDVLRGHRSRKSQTSTQPKCIISSNHKTLEKVEKDE